jgi:hypothetical protein
LPEKYESEKLRGGIQCTAGFGKTVRGEAAVAAMQEKWLTEIDWKFGDRRDICRGFAVASCTAAFLTGGALAGKDRRE